MVVHPEDLNVQLKRHKTPVVKIIVLRITFWFIGEQYSDYILL